MKILVTAKYVSGAAHEGGSSRFLKTVADTLRDMGHDVTITNSPADHVDKSYDLIICSHVLDEINANPARKIFISHGIIGDERMGPGADRYISVSDEVREVNRLWTGLDSEVIPQPIRIMDQRRPNATLKNILIIRRNGPEDDPFAFLAEKYDVRESDINIPIEDQIAWSDICITLGRGALEAMAQGKPVIVADNRAYIGALGDGYVNRENIADLETCNFSGRCLSYPLTREWIEGEISKYDAGDSDFLYQYVKDHHEARMICRRYLEPSAPGMVRDMSTAKIAFGVMINDWIRFDQVLKRSQVQGEMHFVKRPESATKGLNKLLDIIDGECADIAILTHQDMHYQADWLPQVRAQLAKLPDDWVIAGIIGKDMHGNLCGHFRDMRIPQIWDTSDVHTFPAPASCFDECCLIVNMRSGFRFNEGLDGFDLYGSLAVLQARADLGGSAWVIDAYAEHYCLRPFTWRPDDKFVAGFKWLWERYHDRGRVDTTAIGLAEEAA